MFDHAYLDNSYVMNVTGGSKISRWLVCATAFAMLAQGLGAAPCCCDQQQNMAKPATNGCCCCAITPGSHIADPTRRIAGKPPTQLQGSCCQCPACCCCCKTGEPIPTAPVAANVSNHRLDLVRHIPSASILVVPPVSGAGHTTVWESHMAVSSPEDTCVELCRFLL